MGHWDSWHHEARGAEIVTNQPEHTAPLPNAEDRRKELIERVAIGDRDAFADLYGLVAPEAFGLSRRVVRDPAQAEEVTQETMVAVWRDAPRYDRSRGSVLTWVLTIAHRRAVDRVRSSEAARVRDDKAGRRELGVAAPASEPVEVRLDHEQVARALESLTDVQRTAVELAYYNGYTQRQIAQLLDLPVGTVKTRIRDGLIRLRDEFGVQR